MSRIIKEVVIINGSPKTTSESVSGALSALAESRFAAAGIKANIIRAQTCLKSSTGDAVLAKMRDADALLLVFPLYIFCVPAMLMRLLEDYASYLARNGGLSRPQNIYAVVNCGFPEPDINEEAIRVIQCFARHIGASFQFGVALGCGGMLIGAKDAPFIKKALAVLVESLDHMAQGTLGNSSAPIENVSVSVSFPRKIYYFMGNFGWHSMARKNGLKKKDLYAHPYQYM